MTPRSFCLLAALALLCIAVLCEVGAFRNLPAKPFKTSGFVAFVLSFVAG